MAAHMLRIHCLMAAQRCHQHPRASPHSPSHGQRSPALPAPSATGTPSRVPEHAQRGPAAASGPPGGPGRGAAAGGGDRAGSGLVVPAPGAVQRWPRDQAGAVPGPGLGSRRGLLLTVTSRREQHPRVSALNLRQGMAGQGAPLGEGSPAAHQRHLWEAACW